MRRLSLLLSTLLSLLLVSVAAGPARALGPGAIVQDPGCLASALAENDDGSTGLVALPFPLNFLGTTYNALYVNNNGNVTFDEALSEYTPFPLVGADRVIIAAFFGDVDTRGDGSGIVTYGSTTFQGRPAFCVDWNAVGVGYYNQQTDKLNNFQLLLVDRSDVGPGDFDIVFNYDRIEWETGDASGGTGGLGGSSARVGYSNGNSGTPVSLELPGSAVNGAFLDANPAGLIHDSRNSLQLGRYIFPVRNGVAPEGGSIEGQVTDANGDPVLGALVQACQLGSPCAWNGTTNALGRYHAIGLPAGTYTVRAFPPAGSVLLPAQIDVPVAQDENVTDADLQLRAPLGLPPGTTIVPSNPGGGGVPVIYWTNSTLLTAVGCPNGVALYQVTLDTGFVGPSGVMQETPPGSGVYTATIPPLFPHSGQATVSIDIDCLTEPDIEIDFPLYIDPSGVVKTVAGTPIEGATVTLFRSDTGAPGSFTVVPDGSAIMSPSNRQNPDTTSALGQFGWDVIAGFYVVRAEKAGCVSPANPADPFVETGVLTIPPPVVDLDLRLDCGPEKTPAELLQELIDTIDQIGLPAVVEVRLIKDLRKPLNALGRNPAKSGLVTRICGDIGRFVRHVHRQKIARTLAPADMAALLSGAAQVQARLGCSPP
jgi:hypothetical protein